MKGKDGRDASPIKIDDHCRLHYEIHGEPGERPFIIFLNGTLQTTLNWLPLARSLSEHRPVLLYDARGQGQSDLGDRPLSRDLHAGDLLALMERLGIGTARLVGVSHGAQVACAAASAAPDRVEGLVICGAVAAPSSRYRWIVKSWRTVLEEGGLPTLVWAALPWLFGGTFLEENSRTIPGMVKAMVRRNSAAALAAHLKAIIGYGPLGDLAETIRCPVTVMAGMEDLLTPSDGAEKLARAYNGRFIPIPETGHSLPAEAPGALLDALDESLMSYGVNSTTISS